MQRARQHIPSFMGVYIPPCGDIAGGIEIRIGNKAAVCAAERFAVPHAHMQTLGASLGSVCRRNSDNLNPRKPTLVFKEAAELGKRPRVGSASERLVAFLLVSAFANVGQVLNGYALALVLCLLNNLSADSMIDNGCESPLTPTKPFQQPMCAACAFGLNGSPCLVILSPNPIDFCGRIGFALGCDGNIRDTHVNSQKLFAILNILVGNVYCLIEKKLAFDVKEVCFTLFILHQFGAVANIRHFDTTTYNGERSLLFGGVTQNTAVVCNSSKLTECALFFLVKFVCVSDLADGADYKLGGKTVSVLDGVIDLLMQIKLTEATPLPRYCGNSIASLVEHTDCLFQTFGLLSGRQQFDLQGQFHDAKIVKISETVKYLNVYRLTQQKATVQFLPETEDFGVSLNHIL